MKICQRPDCIAKGKPQPLDNFYKNRSRADGRMDHCKDCHKKRANIAVTKDPIDKIFEGYPEVLKMLSYVAKQNVRTPKQQLIYMTKIVLENYEIEEN